MRLEDMREQFPKMPESMKRMIEQEVTVQIGQEKENDNPKVVTYKKRKKKTWHTVCWWHLWWLLWHLQQRSVQVLLTRCITRRLEIWLKNTD